MFRKLGIVLLLLCLLPTMALAQDSTDAPTVVTEETRETGETDSDEKLLTALATIAALVTMIVEMAKPGVKLLPIGDAGHDLVLRVLGFGLGVVFVVGGGEALNLLALSPVYSQYNPLGGLVLTGLIVGSGSQIIYLAASGLAGRLLKPSPDLLGTRGYGG